MRKPINGRAGLLAAVSIFCLSHAGAALAQTAGSQDGEVVDLAAQDSAAGPTGAGQAPEIVVTGIRGSQQRAIEVKRDATSIVDAISAEDIGKLPDVTISDSLQRIPGVQIKRDAGEGASINIRGLPQVVTLLNGESYLGANSTVSVQPNFSDIPSQLFSGAEVIKSARANLLSAGITGTVNLMTRRPFDLHRGLTLAATAEGDYGDRTKKFDPNVNGLVAYHGEDFGLLVSAAYSNLTLGNSYNGIQDSYGATLHNEGLADATGCSGFSPMPTGNPAAPGCTTSAPRPHGTPVAGGIDVNGDGDANDTFIVPQGFTAWDRTTERQRLGINGSFQANLSDALELTADAFFTHQTQYNRTAGLQLQNINWQAAEFVPGQTQATGVMVGDYELNTNQVYNYDLGNFDSYSETFRIKSESQNYNLQLRYDNGGPFRATLRGVYGKAHQYQDQSYLQFSLTNGMQWQPGGIGHYPDGDRAFNPGGYTVNTIAGADSLKAVVDFRGNQPVFSLPSQLVSELGDIGNYALKTMSSEDNYRRNADLKVVRADGEYDFSDALKIQFGARYGDRSVTNYQFERVAPRYAGNGASDPNGCLVKWKAFDVSMNDATCSAGDAGGAFVAGLVRPANDPAFNGQVGQYSVPAQGVPPIYVLNPHAMDDPAAFQESFYPGEQEHLNPGASFSVGVKQISGYFQLNLADGDLLGIPVSGNAGVRVINTKLHIRQNIVGGPLPYGLSNMDAGDVVTDRDFTDFLPAFNLSFNFTRNLRLRLAYARTMTLLNLDQWGGGLNPTYAIDTSTGVFRVSGGSQAGNPDLDPWRADNVDASLEWYLGRASLVSAAVFYINVQSFIQNGIVYRTDLPDNDGVVRNRTVPINTQIQGAGGTLKGAELSGQLAFGDLRFMPVFLRDFGVNANFTFSPSDTGDKDLAGNSIPFQDNSKYQANAALFYQAHGIQARVAWNYRSKRAVTSNYVGGLEGSEVYQAPTNYVDASVSYDVTPAFTVYVQGSNLTGEYERYYITYPDQRLYNNIYERRFMGGVRAKF